MVYKSRQYLNIIETNEQQDVLDFSIVKEALINHLTNSIYLETKGKLYGLITSGDIGTAYNDRKTKVEINKKFSFVKYRSYMEALTIFKERGNVNVLPVVDDNGKLVYEISRYDDLLVLDSELFIDLECYKKKLFDETRVVIFNSEGKNSKAKKRIIEKYYNRLKSIKLNVSIVEDITQLETLSEEPTMLLFVDMNDLYPIGNYYFTEGKKLPAILDHTSTILYYELNLFGKYSEENILRILKKYGVNIVTLGYESNGMREYDKLCDSIKDKYKSIEEKYTGHCQCMPEFYEDFYGEYYQEDYAKTLANTQYIQIPKNNAWFIKDKESKYSNVKNGERKTVNQPKEYDKTIFFFGPCFFLGSFVEDKLTIESYLQNILNDKGYKIKVVNYGAVGDAGTHINRMIYHFVQEIKPGDIVVTYLSPQEGIPHVRIADRLVKENVKAEWFTDIITHHNHIINALIAEELYETIKNNFNLYLPSKEKRHVDESFIKMTYLNRYFSDEFYQQNYNCGSIVMNCNPFTLGHKYLIDEAVKQCQVLIIFVVSEDESLFSFNTRYAMVKAGTNEYKNVYVVPSGNFILSRANFAQYFVKIEDDEAKNNANRDIEMFARDIAPVLGITKRFVGQELNDVVTARYNDAMKEILPQYGIELIEIPRKKYKTIDGVGGGEISATLVRKLLENYEEGSLDHLLPNSTIELMFYKNE